MVMLRCICVKQCCSFSSFVLISAAPQQSDVVALSSELVDDVIVEAGIEGIVNGMDETDWNPATDKFLDVPYDKDSVVQGKASAKEALQALLSALGEEPLEADQPKVVEVNRDILWPMFGCEGARA